MGLKPPLPNKIVNDFGVLLHTLRGLAKFLCLVSIEDDKNKVAIRNNTKKEPNL